MTVSTTAAYLKTTFAAIGFSLALTATAMAQIPVTDTGELPRHDVENEHVVDLLDHSNFRTVGRSNPQGPYVLSARNWTDLYGYAYDGTDPNYAGRDFAYVTTGGFSPRGNFFDVHGGKVAMFDVSADADPEYHGTLEPTCGAASGNCNFLIRDAEIHDGIGYFSSDSGSNFNGGVFVYDLRTDPLNPTQIGHLNIANSQGLNRVHEIGLDVVGPGEAYLYVNDSLNNGRVTIYDVGDARAGITKVADIFGVKTHGVFAQDGVLYVSGDDTVTLYDVSDVGNGNAPQLGAFSTPGGFTHSAWPDSYVDGNGVTRDVMYLTHEQNGTDLQVWDVTGLTQPDTGLAVELVTSISNADLAAEQGTGDVTNVHNLFLVEDRLYTSWTAAGMVVFDVSDPTNPTVIDTFDTSAVESTSNFAGAFGVNASLGPDRVLISDRATGLWVVDTTAVPEPQTGWGFLCISLIAWVRWRHVDA
jgi:hypothetical protein